MKKTLFLIIILVIVITFLSCDYNESDTVHVTDTVYVTDTVCVDFPIKDPEKRIHCKGGFYDPDFPEAGGNTPCCFDIVDIYAIIKSITPNDHVSYKVSFSIFRKSDRKELSEWDNSFLQKYKKMLIAFHPNCFL
jgi:hypothetical protein